MPNYNYIPVGNYPQNFAQPQQVQTVEDIIFVNGELGAKQYPVAAGHVLPLFDSTPDSNVFWLKSSDPMQPLRVFDYKERPQPQITTQQSKELDSLRKEVAELKSLIASISKPLNELLGDTTSSNGGESK